MAKDKTPSFKKSKYKRQTCVYHKYVLKGATLKRTPLPDSSHPRRA